MTDNEIIKALECCINQGFQECKICPLYIQGEPCEKTKLPTIALDLINRQKAEIERLQKANESFSCMGMLYSEIKSEARKEFAERLEEEQIFYEDECGDFVGFVSVKRIDNLLAEMESGQR